MAEAKTPGDFGKVIKKSRLKKPYSQRLIPSGQPGGLWIKEYGLFYHKVKSDRKKSLRIVTKKAVSRLLIIMKKLSNNNHLLTKKKLLLERLKN